jgi:hypothetical protein
MKCKEKTKERKSYNGITKSAEWGEGNRRATKMHPYHSVEMYYPQASGRRSTLGAVHLQSSCNPEQCVQHP